MFVRPKTDEGTRIVVPDHAPYSVADSLVIQHYERQDLTN